MLYRIVHWSLSIVINVINIRSSWSKFINYLYSALPNTIEDRCLPIRVYLVQVEPLFNQPINNINVTFSHSVIERCLVQRICLFWVNSFCSESFCHCQWLNRVFDDTCWEYCTLVEVLFVFKLGDINAVISDCVHDICNLSFFNPIKQASNEDLRHWCRFRLLDLLVLRSCHLHWLCCLGKLLAILEHGWHLLITLRECCLLRRYKSILSSVHWSISLLWLGTSNLLDLLIFCKVLNLRLHKDRLGELVLALRHLVLNLRHLCFHWGKNLVILRQSLLLSLLLLLLRLHLTYRERDLLGLSGKTRLHKDCGLLLLGLELL